MTSSVIVADSSPLISLARRVAERLQIRRIGTLGILQRAKKAGLMSEVKSYIERLLRTGRFETCPDAFHPPIHVSVVITIRQDL